VRSPRSAVTRATVSSGLTGLLGQLALIPSGVIMARALGVEGRGYLALVMLVPFVLAQYGSLGLPVASTYLLAREPGAFGGLLRALALPAALQAVVLTAVHGLVVVLLFRGEGADVWTAALVSLGVVPASLALQYGLAFLQGRSRFGAFNVLRLAPVVVYAFAVGGLALADSAGLVELAVAWAVTTAAAGLFTLAFALATTPRDGAEPVDRGDLLRYGSKGMLGATSPVEGLRVDQVVAGMLLSPAALGVYVVGAALMNLPRFLAQSVGMVAFPVTARGRGGGGGSYVGLTIALMLAIGVALELAAGRLVPFFFGADFADSVSVARILVVAAVLFGIRRVLIDVSLGAGRPLAGTVSELVAGVALVAAMAALVPPFGVDGVAAAVVAGAAASLAMLVARRPRSAAVTARLRIAAVHVAAAAGVVGAAALLARAPEAVGPVLAAGALAAGAAIAVAAEVSLRTVGTIGLYCAAATLAWNDVRLTGSVTVSDGFLLLAGLCLAGSLRGGPDLRPGLRTTGVALVAAGGLLGAAAADELATGLGSYLRLVLGVAGTLALFAVWRPARVEVSRFAAVWVASACLSAGVAVVGSVSGSVRPSGLATHPNHLALIAAIAAGPALAFAATGSSRRRTLGLGAAGLLGAGVLVSGSRSGLLALVAAGALVVLWTGSRRLVLAAGVSLACGALLIQTGHVVLPQQNALDRAVTTSERSVYLSDVERAESRRRALALIDERPLTGAGFEHALLAHNVYVQLLVIGGPLALVGFGLVAASSLGGLRRLGRTAVERRADALTGGLAAGFAAFLVAGAYQNSLWDRYIWVTAALAAAAAVASSPRVRERSPAALVPLPAGSRP
jgi:O-antigen/teichoic acid export membrane protein